MKYFSNFIIGLILTHLFFIYVTLGPINPIEWEPIDRAGTLIIGILFGFLFVWVPYGMEIIDKYKSK